jgi:hypothetical protein
MEGRKILRGGVEQFLPKYAMTDAIISRKQPKTCLWMG